MEHGELRFASYMSEKETVSRWELYWQRSVTFFLLMMLIFSGSVTLAFVERFAIALTAAISVVSIGSATSYWREKYGSRYSRIETFVYGALLAIVLSLVVWYKMTRH